MKGIPDFKIDKWMQNHADKAEVALHSSNARALTLAELQQLCPERALGPVDVNLQLTYGSAKGSSELRSRIAELHSSEHVKLTKENVIVTPGSIMANFLALSNLVGPGDHLICQYPTFAQLYTVPRQFGADVSLWKLKREHDWEPQVAELEALIKPNTKVILINNPGNPTGTVITESTLKVIMALAEKHGITVFSDEVFRPLFHTSDPVPPPFVSLGYGNSLSTGSVSKAHGLPGIRVGWVVSHDLGLLERIMTARDYTTITVSQIDDGVASFALSAEVLPRLMERNLAICQRSLAILNDFAKRYPKRVDLVSSRGGGTSFVQIRNADGTPVQDKEFALKLLEARSLSLLPGHCFSDGDEGDFGGRFRIWIGDDIALQQGLSILEEFLKD